VSSDSDITDRVMKFIDKHWPRIRQYIPAGTVPLNHGFGCGNGLCLHPEAVDDFWVHSRGGKRFTLTTLPPDSFFGWAYKTEVGPNTYS
jgi:hypothetical protein